MANLRLWSPMDQLFRDIADMSRMIDVPNVPVLFKGGEPKVGPKPQKYSGGAWVPPAQRSG